MKLLGQVLGGAAVLAALYGCGGSGGSVIDDNYVFPAGNATLAFTAVSTAQLPAPVGGIDFTVTLPSGMSIATDTGASGNIRSANLTPGSTLVGTSLVLGSYSASTRKAHLVMATASETYRGGEFLRLLCTVGEGTHITLGDLKGANNPIALNQASGASGNASFDLTSKLKVTVGVR